MKIQKLTKTELLNRINHLKELQAKEQEPNPYRQKFIIKYEEQLKK